MYFIFFFFNFGLEVRVIWCCHGSYTSPPALFLLDRQLAAGTPEKARVNAMQKVCACVYVFPGEDGKLLRRKESHSLSSSPHSFPRYSMDAPSSSPRKATSAVQGAFLERSSNTLLSEAEAR